MVLARNFKWDVEACSSRTKLLKRFFPLNAGSAQDTQVTNWLSPCSVDSQGWELYTRF